MTIYLLNAFSTSMLPDGGVVEFSNLNGPEEAREALTRFDEPYFTSAIGHEGTATIFSQLLSLPVSANRIQIELRPGDWAVVGQINRADVHLPTRLPEGKILSVEELVKLPIKWILVEVKIPE